MSTFDKIIVTPKYPSNDQLAQSIKRQLTSLVEPRHHSPQDSPTFIVFRPAGRPGDEFPEAVSPYLEEVRGTASVYILVAFSSRAKDTSDLVPYGKKDKVAMVVDIFIQGGSLAPEGSLNYKHNLEIFKQVAVTLVHRYGLRQKSISKAIPQPAKERKQSEKDSDSWYRKIIPSKREPEQANESTGSSTCGQGVDEKLLHFVGLVTCLLQDFPAGLTVDEISKSLQTNPCSVKELGKQAPSMFKTEPRNGKEIMRLDRRFTKELNEIKVAQQHCIRPRQEKTPPQPISPEGSQTENQDVDSVEGGSSSREPDMEQDYEFVNPQVVISLRDILMFIEHTTTHPEFLHPSVVDAIEKEFGIQGKLLQRLANMCEGQEKMQQSTNFTPPQKIDCTTFRAAIENIQFDETLSKALETEFQLSSCDILSELKQICGEKNKM